VKSLSTARIVYLFACWLAISAFGQERPIHLRNERIDPRPETSLERQANAVANPPKAGLYLIQFTGHPLPAWKDALSGQGVQLLQYVPDDCFIARLPNGDLAALKKLPFVHWIGKYRPDHKLHQAVARRAALKRAGEMVNVSVLLSTDVPAVALTETRRSMKSIRQQSKLRIGTILRGSIAATDLDALAGSENVLWVEPEFRPKLVDEIASKIVAGDAGPNLTQMQDYGFDGTGVRVAVADSGLHTGTASGMHSDLAGRASTFFYYGTLEDASDEHGHGTHVAGIIAGNGATGEVDENGALYGLGVAPAAEIIAQRIFAGDGSYEPPPSFETLTHDAVRSGADIGSNSWGDDTAGRYDLSAAEFDALVRDADASTPGDQQYILEFSAGNAGPFAGTIGSPAVAKNVIATGASQNDRPEFFYYADGIDTMADFSSRGPCEDGRIKPDLVAPGTWISSLRSSVGNDDFAWAVISDNYIYEGGTSQAGPHASGAAAVFVQYYRQLFFHNPSPALVKAALINSAVDMDDSIETGPVPNSDEGWGRIDLTELIGSPRAYQFFDQLNPLTPGQVFEQHIIVQSRDEPLKITLVYTDVPGFPGALPALVNDLDLEVVGPNGLIYFGNQFDEGESIPNPSAPDNLNNVEGVHVSVPDPGEYIVRVRARNVAQDARADTPAVDQDFALVISADLPPPGLATVVLDRPAYTAPSEIRVKLFDTALNQSTATVQLRSTTESSGESLVLRSAGTGIFTGRVATVTGPAVADGRLQVAHGDRIDVSFFDPISQQTRTASAVADFVAPIISNVTITNRFGRGVVSWQTDEPANSIVRFGTNSNLQFAQTNFFLVNSHELVLNDLRPRTTYYIAVISADAAGNVATNNNSGQFFTFTLADPPTVLLVNAYEPDDITPEISLSTYTDALNAIGATYDLWNIETGAASPTTNDLRPYRVVIWRVSDSIGNYPSTLSSAQQTAIKQYVASGGAFLFTSMEHLSRLPATFNRDVLHVQSFSEDVGVPEIIGINNNAISSGVDMALDYSAYWTEYHELLGIDADLSDTLTLTADAAPLVLSAASHEIAGMTYPRIGQSSTGRVAFLSLPLDVLPVTGTPPNTRASFLKKMLDFLAPGQSGIGFVGFDSTSYTLPSQATIEVADSDLSGAGQVSVNLYSDSVTNRITVVLHEVVPRGLFRGFITVVSNTAPAAAGQLRARSGDMIHVEYYDASTFSTRTAGATIDTVSPVISNVDVVPDFVETAVSWDTTEETDALVQYGESPLLGRTASAAEYDISHEVVLYGLAPDRVYYFQVVSRDIAGNTVVDDNNGQLYTFRTLKPVIPPYFENFDAGSTNWQVFSSDDSQSEWTLGVPNNGVETAAHSPPNAWGSSLHGESLDAIETFLISPPIDLTSGNSARVSFWSSYDFTSQSEFDVYEQGEFMIITNTATQPVSIAAYEDSSFGWYEEELDLTPYVGNVVYLVWYHVMLSLESAPRAGWLVDDVSVALSNLPTGTIVVTNNLMQAQYLLNGPTSRSGRGPNVFNNMMPGTYVISFSPVPYYQTPPSQTNLLQANTTVLFNGVYTFADANNNGISDVWEQQFFGSVSPSRTRFTDTDGDGATDFAEFIGGTNPTATNSYLQMVYPTLLPNGSVRLQWNSVSGRAYRVEGSANAVSWSPVSDWIQATGSPTTITLSPPVTAYLFRLQVRP